MSSCPLVVAIGNGGNEMGMGEVYPTNIISNPKIVNGDQIGYVRKANCLVAASVNNWGGYTLVTGVALMESKMAGEVCEGVTKCVPTEEEEVTLLQCCIAVGCHYGVNGKVEATVDGMPLKTSIV